MSPEHFAAELGFEHFYHVAPSEAYELIAERGLLSPAALAEAMGLDADATRDVLTTRRAQITQIGTLDGAPITLNDNSTLLIAALAPALDDGLSPADWLEILNRRVFLFTDPVKAEGFANAKAVRAMSRDIWTFDAWKFIRQFYDRLEISPLNTGYSMRAVRRRGLWTFAPIEGLDFAKWRRRRMQMGYVVTPDVVKEVVIRHAAPNAARFAVDVRRRTPDGVWNRRNEAGEWTPLDRQGPERPKFKRHNAWR